MARRVIFMGTGTGVGCTSMCAMLGIGLANLGKKVVVIDLGVGDNLTALWGLDSMAIHDITDVLSGKCRLSQALMPTKVPLLYCLPSSGISSKVCDFTRFFEVLAELSQSFDFILIDCPSFFYPHFYADAEIIVVSTHKSEDILENLISVLIGNKNTIVRVLFNKLKNKDIRFVREFCAKTGWEDSIYIKKIKNFAHIMEQEMSNFQTEFSSYLAKKFLGVSNE